MKLIAARSKSVENETDSTCGFCSGRRGTGECPWPPRRGLSYRPGESGADHTVGGPFARVWPARKRCSGRRSKNPLMQASRKHRPTHVHCTESPEPRPLLHATGWALQRERSLDNHCPCSSKTNQLTFAPCKAMNTQRVAKKRRHEPLRTQVSHLRPSGMTLSNMSSFSRLLRLVPADASLTPARGKGGTVAWLKHAGARPPDNQLLLKGVGQQSRSTKRLNKVSLHVSTGSESPNLLSQRSATKNTKAPWLTPPALRTEDSFRADWAVAENLQESVLKQIHRPQLWKLHWLRWQCKSRWVPES